MPSVLNPTRISAAKAELIAAIEEDAVDYGDVFDKGMVHNCMARGATMAAVLDQPVMNAYVSAILGDSCILYAYQSSSLPPSASNYGHRIHVDSPRFIPGYVTNVGVIFPLDDFNDENGGTEYLPGSHRTPGPPTAEEFEQNMASISCRAGDMIVFNARLYHRSGANHTDRYRHALTLNFCRSYMRQRFDFPRLLDPGLIESLGEDGKRLVGMNVRVPTKLEEFYLPEEERLYKPNQG